MGEQEDRERYNDERREEEAFRQQIEEREWDTLVAERNRLRAEVEQLKEIATNGQKLTALWLKRAEAAERQIQEYQSLVAQMDRASETACFFCGTPGGKHGERCPLGDAVALALNIKTNDLAVQAERSDRQVHDLRKLVADAYEAITTDEPRAKYAVLERLKMAIHEPNEPCPHTSSTRFVGCGGRWYELCDGCEAITDKGEARESTPDKCTHCHIMPRTVGMLCEECSKLTVQCAHHWEWPPASGVANAAVCQRCGAVKLVQRPDCFVVDANVKTSGAEGHWCEPFKRILPYPPEDCYTCRNAK